MVHANQPSSRLGRLKGIRAEVLSADVAPEEPESWYEKKLQQGMQVCLGHRRLVSTGLDYVEFEGTMIWYSR
jgi:hypothetical protein